MKKILFVITLIFVFSCNRNSQNIKINETYSLENVIVSIEVDENNIIKLEENELNNTKQFFPIIMYVNLKEGLQKHSSPSEEDNIIGLLLYGERIIIEAKTDTVETIENITDYWYRIRDRNYSDVWVFGGYISENFPSEALVIIGLWEEEDNTSVIHYFNPNFIYQKGIKDSESYRNGKQELNKNKLTFMIENNSYENLNNLEIEEASISILNNNTIILDFVNEKQTILKRSNDVWVYY